MPQQRRVDATRNRTRRGGLPAATEHTRQLGLGDGMPCDGCAETINPTDMCSTVTVVGGLRWRFHDVCYETWLSFEPE